MMKRKYKIIVAGATAVVVTSLLITPYQTKPSQPPILPQNRPVSEVVEVDKAYTPPTQTPPLVGEENQQISTQSDEIIESALTEIPSTQPTEKEETTFTPTPYTHTSTNPTTPIPTEPLAQHYLRTKILGAYETTQVIWQSDSEGNSHRTFGDSFVYTDENSHTIERDMEVEGKLFRVYSVFSINNTSSPIKKML